MEHRARASLTDSRHHTAYVTHRFAFRSTDIHIARNIIRGGQQFAFRPLCHHDDLLRTTAEPLSVTRQRQLASTIATHKQRNAKLPFQRLHLTRKLQLRNTGSRCGFRNAPMFASRQKYRNVLVSMKFPRIRSATVSWNGGP